MKHSSNSFSSLGQETTDKVLKNDRELRNTYKKHKKKKQKYDLNPSEDLLKEINILEILIKEYVDSQKGPQKQKTSKKNKKRKQSKNGNCSGEDGDDEKDDFLEKEFQKNKDFNNKRFKQQKEDEEKKKKEKQERQKEEEEEWERRRQRKSYYESPEDKKQTIPRILENHEIDIHNIPEDITPLLYNYDHKLYKKLCLKYHPDKYEGESYIKLLNCLKDLYQS